MPLIQALSYIKMIVQRLQLPATEANCANLNKIYMALNDLIAQCTEPCEMGGTMNEAENQQESHVPDQVG